MSESNVLLDDKVLTDPKIQTLLLTVLVRAPYLLPISPCVFCLHIYTPNFGN